MLSRTLSLLCEVNHKEIFLRNQTKRLGKWKFQQHMKEAQAAAKIRACYSLGLQDLVNSGNLSEDDSVKWAEINSRLLSLQQDPKSLLLHSRRRLSREYTASPDGLGRTPRESTD